MYQTMSLVLAVCWSLHLIPTAGTEITMILQEDTEEKKKGWELEGEQSSVIQVLFWTIQSLGSTQSAESSTRKTNILG